jgi:hypothetical protein
MLHPSTELFSIFLSNDRNLSLEKQRNGFDYVVATPFSSPRGRTSVVLVAGSSRFEISDVIN